MPLTLDKRIYLLGGPGGVGKTTLAASLALHLADQGYRTLVLTVDPAKRLAQALGFSGFSVDIQPVDLGDPKKVLFASMLDSERYFDKVVGRFSRDEAQREKILKNPLYRAMVENLGGTHEYAAMERLLEFANDSQFDKIVVDTPPTQNAMELLSAPLRLANFMDNSVLKWFQGSNPRYLNWFKQGTKLAMKLLEKIFGGEFLKSFANFLDDIEGLQAGFRSRHLEVIKLLQSDATSFWLVTTASEARFFETNTFSETLANFGMRLHRIVLNRLEETYPPVPNAPELKAPLEKIAAFHGGVVARQEHWQGKFLENFSNVPFSFVKRRGSELHELKTLTEIGATL